MEELIQPGCVSVHALSAGVFSLPEKFFVSPLADPEARKMVPSLSFLIKHKSPSTSYGSNGRTTRILFDLGIRRDVSSYSHQIQKHLETRQPLATSPCVVESLAAGGLTPDDIDYVVLSHVHWDHIGTPSDFQKSKFIVGYGSLDLLSGRLKLENGSHSHFEAGLLPSERTIELIDPESPVKPPLSDDEYSSPQMAQEHSGEDLLDFYVWRSMPIFPATLDIFGDGSLFIVNAPGHLPGHLTLLCRTSISPTRYVLLAADSCHDRRLITGEKEIAEWPDAEISSVIHCIHVDKKIAEETIRRIRNAENGYFAEFGHVEVVLSHDPVWAQAARMLGRFFPGHL